MTKQVHYHPHLIFSVGTQVLTLKDVVGQNRRTLQSDEELPRLYRERWPY